MQDTTTQLEIQLTDREKSLWYRLQFDLKKQYGKKPDMNALLFLVGMNELGIVREFSKQEKMDLMHIATCKLLSYEGHFVFSYKDEDGWPHYEQKSRPPYGDLLNQELLLRRLLVRYFDESGFFETEAAPADNTH
ncbi:MAG: hypothetical protein L6Q78_01255 [Bacteroidia bacterium]|nr:hypothetical protein [Bacteroidia bacterium]